MTKYKYTLSCTTSPTRLKGLARNFRSWPPQRVHRVILTVPELFRNDPELGLYDPKDLAQFRDDLKKLGLSVVIHRVPHDTGPNLKLLGSLEIAADPEILVVLDDDVLYHQDLLRCYDDAYQTLEAMNRPYDRYVVSPEPIQVFGVPAHPGYLSFSVRKRFIQDVAQFQQCVDHYESLHPRCKRHDDLSMGLTTAALGLRHVALDFPKPKDLIFSLDIGFSTDSLMYQGSTAVKSAWCSSKIYEDLQVCPRRPWIENVSDFFLRKLWTS